MEPAHLEPDIWLNIFLEPVYTIVLFSMGLLIAYTLLQRYKY